MMRIYIIRISYQCKQKTPADSRKGFLKYGAPGGIRTCNRSVRSRVLYPVEPRAQFFCL